MTLKENGRPKGICIVAQFAYGALVGGTTGQLGGVERQTSMLARWLASRGHRVSLVTFDEGQSGDCVIDGVHVVKMCGAKTGIPGLRFFVPRWTSLISALSRADADVYYHNCGEHITGQVALWCRLRDRRFVFSSAHDFDCDISCPGVASFREKALLRYGVRHADGVIVQTLKQKMLLHQGYGLDSTVLPMPCPGPAEIESLRSPFLENPVRILWVGRISEVKRLEWLLDLANVFPEIAFDVAGLPDSDTRYSRSVVQRAGTIANVTLHGRVARNRMPQLYERATMLVSTSLAEGFPNTFLEAWSFGKPVVSTFDPDHLIRERKLGIAVESFESLVSGVRSMLENRVLWSECSRAAREYFVTNHSVDSVMRRYEEYLLRVIEAEPGSNAEEFDNSSNGRQVESSASSGQ